MTQWARRHATMDDFISDDILRYSLKNHSRVGGGNSNCQIQPRIPLVQLQTSIYHSSVFLPTVHIPLYFFHPRLKSFNPTPTTPRLVCPRWYKTTLSNNSRITATSLDEQSGHEQNSNPYRITPTSSPQERKPEANRFGSLEPASMTRPVPSRKRGQREQPERANRRLIRPWGPAIAARRRRERGGKARFAG
ncbi:hypothetical protein KM043_018013 [Ampulex compressa]|nr:hypothetical protein KM043_018013 [Ampulex compressa]